MIAGLDRLQRDQAELQAAWARLRDQRQAVELRDGQALGSATGARTVASGDVAPSQRR